MHVNDVVVRASSLEDGRSGPLADTLELIAEGEKTGTVGLCKMEKGELFLVVVQPKGVKALTDFTGLEAPVYVLRHAREWEELRLIVPAAQAFLALCASH